MAVTANQIIGRAFALLNVYLPGENPSANDGLTAFEFLNMMIGSWAQQRGTIPVISREVFDTVANQGGPDNPYTIGVGGDFDTQRPPNQAAIVATGLLLNPGTASEVEMPRAKFTDDMWQQVQIKNLSNSLWTDVYYNPTYADNLGTINLWPVPTTGDNDLVLYLAKAISEFADQNTTSYDFPQGYEKALVYNLADELQVPFGRELAAPAMRQARESLALIKRVNLTMEDLSCDMLWNANIRNYGYNILTSNL